MNTKKQLWILSGGNGAGKSTFYHTQLEPLGLPFVNADLIASEVYPNAPEAHSYNAALIAEKLRNNMLSEGRSFCFETVFSHPSKIDFVAKAKVLGYEIILTFIHLDRVSLNKSRISQRIATGGHSVPDKKVESRIPRTLVNIKKVLPLCNYVTIVDNSRADNPFVPLATIRNHKLSIQSNLLPEWCKQLISDYK